VIEKGVGLDFDRDPILLTTHFQPVDGANSVSGLAALCTEGGEVVLAE
jgi:hypothetical protein